MAETEQALSALESAEYALAHDPDNATAFFRGAVAAQALGEMMLAGRFCDRALVLRPQDQDLLAFREKLFAQHADLPELLDMGEQLLREAGEYLPAPNTFPRPLIDAYHA